MSKYKATYEVVKICVGYGAGLVYENRVEFDNLDDAIDYFRKNAYLGDFKYNERLEIIVSSYDETLENYDPPALADAYSLRKSK